MDPPDTQQPSTRQASDGAPCYLDNNATTMMRQDAIDAMLRWTNRGNPSAEYASAREAQKLMAGFRAYIAKHCGFELCDGEEWNGRLSSYHVIFTSGASESNCHIITGAVRSWSARTKMTPHVITSAIEHKSLLSCCERLQKEGLTQLTILPVRTAEPGLGTVDPEAVRNAVRENTCVISIMAANNETGTINNLQGIGRIARERKIPFHTDAVQLFGKSVIRLLDLDIDALSVSFHKLHGPPGVGILILRSAVIVGYDFCSHICGSQNGGMRGGTENIPGIAASFAAVKHTLTNRGAKNAEMRRLRDAIKTVLAEQFGAAYLYDYKTDPRVRAMVTSAETRDRPFFVWIAPRNSNLVLPNTLLVAVKRRRFCNKAARAALEARGVIVSIGSACNTADALAPGQHSSHVVRALDVPEELGAGILRISLSDDTTEKEIVKFLREFIAVTTGPECLMID